jgi:signal transduction histidine kinase
VRVKAVVTAALSVLVAFALWGAYEADASRFALDAVVAVVSCVLVPVALRRPIGGGLVLAALAALSPAATPTASFGVLNAARQRRFPPAALITGVGIAAQAVQGWWRPTGGLSYGWWLVLMAAAYAALLGWGALAQARQALLCELRERARRAEAEQGRRVAEARVAERRRIAREMHDVLAHRLSLVATYAGALEYRPDSSPEQLSRAAGVVRAGVRQALEELREVITVMGDETEDEGVLPELKDIPQLITEVRAAGTPVTFDDLTDSEGVPAIAGRTAYRMVQEGLTNARKHAPGEPVTVSLRGAPGQGMTVEIRNPAGPDPSGGKGLGLIGLAERVQLAGGTLDHELSADGFRLRARLPWPA